MFCDKRETDGLPLALSVRLVMNEALLHAWLLSLTLLPPKTPVTSSLELVCYAGEMD